MTEMEKAAKLLELLDAIGIPDSPDFTEDEWDALCEEAPMTFEMFISCLEKCAKYGDAEYYCRIIDQFPEYEEQLDKYFEEKFGIKKFTPEELEERGKIIEQRICEHYGK